MNKSYLNSVRNTALSLKPSKAIRLLLMVLFFVFSGVVNAQCSITSTTNTSALTCGISPLSSCGGYLYIGDGTTTMSLVMNNNLDLTCLGAILFIVRNNATLDFSSGNYDLKLAAGSSIEFETGSSIYSGGGCSASDRIYVGGSAVSNCNGSGSAISFTTLVTNGGFSSIDASASPSTICNSGSSTITATANPLSGATYTWYTVASGGTSIGTGASIAVSPSSTTTYYVEASYSSPAYTTVRKPVTVEVTNASVPTGTAAQSFCASNSPTVANLAATGTAIKWYAGSTGGSAFATTTALVDGTHYYATQTLSGCESATRFDVTATVNNDDIPSVGTITQPTCAAPTGSVVLSDLPATGTWTLTRSGTSSATTTGTGTSVSISGLGSGTYYYAVTNGSCTSGTSTGVTINTTTKTWNGSWSPSAPTSEDAIVFEGTGTYSSTSDLSACSCLVKNSASVVINSGHTLTLTNELTVIDFGSIAFLDTASLLQINDVTNSGDIDYQRIINARETDYTYWSSPVSPQTLGELYPLGSTFYSYEATASGEDWKEETGGTTMDAGKGYIANRGAEVPSGVPLPPGLYDATFVGVPNNGTKTIAIGPTGTSNLIGNPYPSVINADLFLATNSTLVEGTIYFWTHNTAIQLASNLTIGTAGSGVYAYTSDDYASYNTTGGVGTGNSINGVEQAANKPTGKIAAGQAFFTTSMASGTVTFNNSMRVSGNNTQFFKTKNPNTKSAKTIEKNRVWLNLTNTKGAFKQTLIGYITDATNDYDNRFDGESFDGNEFVDFYSLNQDKDLVIQGRALPFDENDEVPLGFRTTINGDFTINIDQVDGLLTDQAVFIEDKLTNTVFNLKSGNYTFNTVPGTFNDRFVLRYKNNSKTLGTANLDALEKMVLVSNKNKQIKINSFAETIDKVSVYDLLGRQIYQKDKVNSNELTIADLLSNHQTLVIKTVMQNGETVTDKIIY